MDKYLPKVRTILWAHGNDLPFDQLHMFAGVKDANISHFVILFARPQLRSWFENVHSIQGHPLRC